MRRTRNTLELSETESAMSEPLSMNEFSIIPGKQYFTIGEVSKLCVVKPHVLRYWEQEFSHVKPIKRRGNRRYYQREDILHIRQIRTLLYEEGYTIAGARVLLAGDKAKEDANISSMLIKQTIEELEEVLNTLNS